MAANADMDWQATTNLGAITEPSAPSTTGIGGFLSSLCGFVRKPVYAIVRAFQREKKAANARNNIRRRVPIPPIPTRERVLQGDGDIIRPTVERKRKASEEVGDIEGGDIDSMKPSKRRLRELDTNFNDYSPWKTELWVQETIKETALLPDSSVSQEEHKTKYIAHAGRNRSSISPLRADTKKYPSYHFSPYKRTPRPVLPKVVTLSRAQNGLREFLWAADEEDEKDTMDEETPKQDNTAQSQAGPVKAEAVGAKSMPANLARPAPIQQKMPSPSTTNDEKSTEASSSLFDEEEDAEYRAYLRRDHLSFDADGYKLPIDGWISPQTKKWNEEHQQRLASQAAIEQQTPSRPPREFSPDTSPDPLQEVTLKVKIEKTEKTIYTSPFVEDVPQEEEKGRSASPVVEIKPEIAPQMESPAAEDVSAVKEEQPEAIVEEDASVPTDILETPAKQLQNLKISEDTTAKEYRTPKAGIFGTVRTDRKTRRQVLIEERELEKARGEYKLVPLSAEWDRKVRNAVKNGHARWEATDFARVVPQYSGFGHQSKWLNDAVINDYIAMVAQHGCRDDRSTQVPTVAALSSYFFAKMSDPANAPKRWTRKIAGKSLLECELILLPINSGSHWTLCTIEPKKCKVTMYNSMGHGSNASHARTILGYLKFHLGNAFEEGKWTVNDKGVSPQQTNSDDCGVFACTTARQIMLGQMDKTPYTHEIMPIARKRLVAELVNGGLIKADES
ncbi:hypothetical protein LTR64_005426 [Lithohypha guttulata]|uniref:uncharacterized protein n=1 Tax=Lithohypha guttulata TaxID=1690604 RepID=UPI002DDF92BC|nr:hypothetical protein LTR51_002781 [Lithohypha guttulata]